MEDDVEKQFVNTSYLDCLLHYDCNVIMLTLNNPNVEEVLDLCDAFLITGGSDLDPKYYGEENSDEESYVSVDDEETLTAVFEIFKEKFKEEFNFTDGE